MRMNEMIREIKALRGTTVKVFGQDTKIDKEVDNLTIDVLDVLDVLEEFESDVTLDEVEQMYEIGEIEEVASDNSYNWGSPISNDINFMIYKDIYTDTFYTTLKVHRFGDVRCNYTEEVVLEYSYENEIFEPMTETDKYIHINDFGCVVSIFSDTIEVLDAQGEHITDVCVSNIQELEQELKTLSE